jgi:hypothetical protein
MEPHNQTQISSFLYSVDRRRSLNGLGRQYGSSQSTHFYGGSMSIMDIYAPTGTKVRFINANGYDHERKAAASILDTAKTYTVASTNVRQSSSSVYLQEIPTRSFNTVMFETVEDETKLTVEDETKLTVEDEMLTMELSLSKAKTALLLVQAELKKSGNWSKHDYNWPEVKQSILDALNSIKKVAN